MQQKSAYAREMHVITKVVAKFRHYLLGHKFVTKTDHQSLKEMQAQVIQTPVQQTWLPKLLGFDFTIEYKRGKDNQAADALSQAFFSCSSLQFDFLHQLRHELEHYDPLLEFPTTTIDPKFLVKHDDLWFWKDRLFIPA